jgi:DNA-binding CsgD family transcriptional regulator/N-acetylneuraminic acid mutarotase
MPEDQPHEQLSAREKQVLELIVTGASNKEIAQQLVISVNTVKVHARNIFEKLGVQSRTEATLLAIQEKLVAVPESESAAPEDAQPASVSGKTYLLSSNPALVLSPWQQVYLAVAMLAAVAVAVVPLLARDAPRVAPELPVIYSKAPTPAPVAAQPASPQNRWITNASMPTERAGLALIPFERQLYAIGGVRGNNKATRSVEIFDTMAGSWSEGASKPSAVTNIAGVQIGEQIYVPGGCTNDGLAVDALEIFDPEADSWTKGQALPQPRCGYGLAAFQDNLYLFGGWDGEQFVDTILTYSPAADAWETLPQTLPQPVGFMGAATLGDAIYIAGGYNGETEFSQTYAFDPRTGSLEEKAALQEKRGGLGLISGGGNLYAIGGGWQHESSLNEKYDPANNSWTSFESPFSSQWRNLGLAAIDTTIYAVGGWDGTAEEYLDSNVSYQFLFQLFLPISSFQPE